jgi:hypothetical protein
MRHSEPEIDPVRNKNKYGSSATLLSGVRSRIHSTEIPVPCIFRHFRDCNPFRSTDQGTENEPIIEYLALCLYQLTEAGDIS